MVETEREVFLTQGRAVRGLENRIADEKPRISMVIKSANSPNLFLHASVIVNLDSLTKLSLLNFAGL